MNPRTPLTPAHPWGHCLSLNPFAALRRKKQPVTRLEVTGRPSTFAAFGGDPYANDVFRSGVDAIARIAAKFVLQPKVSFSDGTEANGDERLARLLQLEPNPLMSAYDMLYQIYTHLYVTNNAFAYLQRDAGQIVAVWPLHVTSCNLAQGRDGEMYAGLTFASGTTAILPYRDLVHLRRHFNQGDVLGDSNAAIAAGVELAHAQNEGIKRSIAQGGQLRGLIKYAGSLSPSKLKEYQEHFNQTQLTGNVTGVIMTPNEVDFTPITDSAPTINAADVEATQRKIFDYLGLTESIVNSSFDDDGFGAFDEAIVEALALQTALEWTRKAYTPLQVARGRRIDCSTSRIRYIGTKNRAELIKHAAPLGALTVDEVRDLMGLPHVEGGERRLQSLNYASVELVDQYQLYAAQRGIHSMEGADSE